MRIFTCICLAKQRRWSLTSSLLKWQHPLELLAVAKKRTRKRNIKCSFTRNRNMQKRENRKVEIKNTGGKELSKNCVTSKNFLLCYDIVVGNSITDPPRNLRLQLRHSGEWAVLSFALSGSSLSDRPTMTHRYINSSWSSSSREKVLGPWFVPELEVMRRVRSQVCLNFVAPYALFVTPHSFAAVFAPALKLVISHVCFKN